MVETYFQTYFFNRFVYLYNYVTLSCKLFLYKSFHLIKNDVGKYSIFDLYISKSGRWNLTNKSVNIKENNKK